MSIEILQINNSNWKESKQTDYLFAGLRLSVSDMGGRASWGPPPTTMHS